ncbi:MAG TPA: phosphate acetyltransferase, partial [Segetibacter sp.]|nr:phosphate acetyltransferase [Segetibacter sp.]
MTKSIFIATTEPYSGKSLVALGLVNLLLGKTKRIGYFKPIINLDPGEGKDTHIETTINYFNLGLKYEDSYAFTRSQAMKQMENESQGSMMNTIIRKYKKIEEDFDFTVIEGSDFLGEGTAFEFDLNLSVAKNLAAPVIVVSSGKDKSTGEIVSAVLNVLRNFHAREVQVLSVLVNRVRSEQLEDVRQLLSTTVNSGIILGVIPEDKALSSPSMKEILENLDGDLLIGEQQLNNPVDNFVIGAMNVPNFLSFLKENVLIITPGDRGDMIIAALQANLSASYPKVAGIVLTAGYQLEEPIIRLLKGLETVIPIIYVQTGTFETSQKIGAIKSRITPDNHKKIQLAISIFEKSVDLQALDQKIVTFTSEGITPHMFQYQLAKWAKKKIKHIVLPEGNDERILKATARLVTEEVVTLTLLGDPKEIALSVKRLGLSLDLSRIRIINPAQSEYYEDYVNTLYELRKNKSVNQEMARDLMTDVSYFGTMMVYKGHADGMVSGACHTTQHTIRPALQFVKTKPGTSIVSSIFFMCLPDRVAVFGDCAVNPNPTAEQLAEIAISSADSSLRFGIEPRIAMLSYSSGTSGEGADVEKVRLATEI